MQKQGVRESVRLTLCSFWTKKRRFFRNESVLGRFVDLKAPQKPQIFFGRAFGAREAPPRTFEGNARKNKVFVSPFVRRYVRFRRSTTVLGAILGGNL